MQKKYVRVVNWDRFQHYKDRNPPWIKLHNSFLEDPAVAALPDAMKAHVIGCWLLASRLDNKIPADEAFIGKRINATTKVNIKTLITMGFLEPHPECLQDASELLASCYTPSNGLYTETEERQRREETEERKKTAAKASLTGEQNPEVFAAIDAYNAVFGTSIGTTPGNLRAAVRALEFGYTIAQIQRVFEAVKGSETESARWCHENKREFAYLVRPEYKRDRDGAVIEGRIDAILSELATGAKAV